VPEKNDTDVARYMMLHCYVACTSTGFGNFWQRCCWESMLSNGDLSSHLS